MSLDPTSTSAGTVMEGSDSMTLASYWVRIRARRGLLRGRSMVGGVRPRAEPVALQPVGLR